MDYTNLIFPAMFIIGIATLIFLGIYYSPKHKILRQLKKTRRKNIQSVREHEYVKIVGNAKHVGKPLIAPLSKRECVYFEVIVKENKGKQWRNVIKDVQFQDFFIQTGTESAVLHLNARREFEKLIHLVTDHSFHSRVFNNTNAAIVQYLNEHGIKDKSIFGMNKPLQYQERIIEVNEEIAIMGIGNWQIIDTPMDSYSDGRILVLSGTKEQRLLVTDEPKAMKRVKRKL
ncbi:hypothetical protein IMCC3317_32060 [Kordia antarctica]|uniref:RING-type E3 ubiquitin transferase n=1 Tax=Kordia antarctica TaxID=1218801 RepID=A0A7L4ZMA5_9FLAO|nr:hypothetical protein [Kordia antarctica]QHI37823.1 hypothetical protein IMCC3317_32060 [Kordia antarctica]